jgi:non-ribosomal peptide synthetase component E (peptide arylation enzyme)
MKPTRFTNAMIEKYYGEGYWHKESSVDIFDRNAGKYPTLVAIKDNKGNQITWGQLKVYSDRVALHLLRMGFKHDDGLVVQLPNMIENCIIRVALQKVGVIASFPAMTMRDAEIESIIDKTGARGIIVHKEDPSYDFLAMARDLKKRTDLKFVFVISEAGDETLSIKSLMEKEVNDTDLLALKQTQIQPHEVAILQCTSGTTGFPRVCEWPDAPILLHGRAIIERMNITMDDVLGIMAPMAGVPGLAIWNAGFQVPCKMVLQERSGAEEDLRLIEREKITIIGLVPAQMIRMLRHPTFEKYDLRSLRAIRPAGAPMSPTVAKEIEEKLPWCKVVVASGTSESMTLGHTHIDDPFEDRLLTVGKPWPHNEIKVINEKGEAVPQGGEGEILVRGACTGGGYFKDKAMTVEAWITLGEDGWYKTGDIGRINEKGNLQILGRKKDIIIRGGQNIYPKEVEDMLLKHPKVADVAIVSMPDPVMGEKACAFAITRGNQRLTLEELSRFLDTLKIAKFKYPERLIVLDKFPCLGTEKVDRKVLKGWAVKLAEEDIRK